MSGKDKMIIEKKASLNDNYYNKITYFSSARQAFEKILFKLKQDSFTLFLPAYIGWSPREGSGIYDPVLSTGIKHAFYALDTQLNINLDNLENLLDKEEGKKAVLLVDYFGFIDAEYNQAIEIMRKYEAFIIEDAAHAFYTDYIDGKCGRKTDIVFYSLHKLFPCDIGGMVKINNEFFNYIAEYEEKTDINPFEYRLDEIAECRKKNALEIQKLLSGNRSFGFIRPMEKYLNCTPQTVPVIIRGYDKSDLYFRMNELGFGVVSLYHTMIEPIRNGFSQAVEIGSSILNLPVHQDINFYEIEQMCITLNRLCPSK